MKRKLLAVSSLVLSLSLLTGVGTYAFFNAQTSTVNNNFTAGRITLTSSRDAGDPVDGPMFYTTPADGVVLSGPNAGRVGVKPDGIIKPGFVSLVKTLIIENTGPIDPKLTKLSAELQAGDRVLANALKVEVYEANDPDVLIYTGFLNSLLENPQNLRGAIPMYGVGSLEYLKFKISFPDDNTDQNAYQGKGIMVRFKVHAEPQ